MKYMEKREPSYRRKEEFQNSKATRRGKSVVLNSRCNYQQVNIRLACASLAAAWDHERRVERMKKMGGPIPMTGGSGRVPLMNEGADSRDGSINPINPGDS